MPDEWYVVVKISERSDVAGQTDLEQYAQDVADSVRLQTLENLPSFVSTHVAVLYDKVVNSVKPGIVTYVRPSWAKDHVV